MSQNEEHKLSVLVIEDDESIAQLLKFLLEHEQYLVHSVMDGQLAREFILKQEPASIVLLDVMLPYVDGFELMSLIRATPNWKSVPVIMLTAKTQEKDAVRALDAGANDYIHKPFSPAELLARIRRYVRNHG
jgi:hypothetical protein